MKTSKYLEFEVRPLYQENFEIRCQPEHYQKRKLLLICIFLEQADRFTATLGEATISPLTSKT